ncbi:hypothetical protein YB2330_000294 [Saitoella coloradoensis]
MPRAMRRWSLLFIGLVAIIIWTVNGAVPKRLRFDGEWQSLPNRFNKEGWLSGVLPGSSTQKTRDFTRSDLPSLPTRCPVYTYFDPSQHNAATLATEQQLLLTWRRAFWAAGFLPTVLGPDDAKKDHRAIELAASYPGKKLPADVASILAWAEKGTGGVLSDYRIVPLTMAESTLLQELNNCKFDKLQAYEPTGLGFIHASPEYANQLANHLIKPSNPGASALDQSKRLFEVHADTPPSIAYYSPANIENLGIKPEKLPEVVNSHLHESWIRAHNATGITALDPFKKNKHAQFLSLSAYRTAYALSQCPPSPLSTPSCPPFHPDCGVCVSITLTNTSNIPATLNEKSPFMVATMPHPRTFAAQFHQRTLLAADFVRRRVRRDLWATAVTLNTMSKKAGAPARGEVVKKAVLGAEGDEVAGKKRGLWTAWEAGWDNLEWELGFSLPTPSSSPALAKIDAAIKEREDRYRSIWEPVSKAVMQKKVDRETALLEGNSLTDGELWEFIMGLGVRREEELQRYANN